jgi:hypothetical protein
MQHTSSPRMGASAWVFEARTSVLPYMYIPHFGILNGFPLEIQEVRWAGVGPIGLVFTLPWDINWIGGRPFSSAPHSCNCRGAVLEVTSVLHAYYMLCALSWLAVGWLLALALMLIC